MPRALTLPSDPVNELTGKVALITGGSSGIGRQTAVHLARRNCTVVITSRSAASGEKAAREIRETASKQVGQLVPAVGVVTLDVRGSLASIVASAKAFREKYDRLDILCLNAGSVTTPKQQADGLDEQYVERLVANHILTSWLWDLLLKSGTTENPSRVIPTLGIAIAWAGQTSQKVLETVQNPPNPGEISQKECMHALAGWTRLLGQACSTSGVPVLFVMSHPGVSTDTNIHGCMTKCLGCCVGSHPAKEGALPNVAAATMPATELQQGGIVGPMSRTKGPPAVEEIDQDGDDATKWKCITGEPNLTLGSLALRELSKKCKTVDMPNEVFAGLDIPR